MAIQGTGTLSCGRKELLDENGNVVFWYVNDTLDQVFTFLNPDGSPVDLTGLIYNGVLKRDFRNGSFVASAGASKVLSISIMGIRTT